jgi:membrane protease YdiL (CAAX protease family)
MLLPGPLLFLIYKTFVDEQLISALSLFSNKKDLANMIAGFSYTMLGFLATVITILFSFTKSVNFESYRRNGYLTIFFVVYFVSIACLLFTAFLTLYGFSPGKHVLPFNFLMMSFANNLFHILFVTLVICNISKESVG